MEDKWDQTKKAYNYNFYNDFYEKTNAEFILCDKDRTNKANMIYEIYSSYTGLDYDAPNKIWSLENMAGFSRTNTLI